VSWPNFTSFHSGAKGEHLHEAFGQHGGVLAAKRADGVVIRMGVGGEETHGDVGVRGPLDARELKRPAA
jgi:hypothetical protein